MDKLNRDPKEKTLSVMQKFLNEAQEILYQIPDLNLEKLRRSKFCPILYKECLKSQYLTQLETFT